MAVYHMIVWEWLYLNIICSLPSLKGLFGLDGQTAFSSWLYATWEYCPGILIPWQLWPYLPSFCNTREQRMGILGTFGLMFMSAYTKWKFHVDQVNLCSVTSSTHSNYLNENVIREAQRVRLELGQMSIEATPLNPNQLSKVTVCAGVWDCNLHSLACIVQLYSQYSASSTPCDELAKTLNPLGSNCPNISFHITRDTRVVTKNDFNYPGGRHGWLSRVQRTQFQWALHRNWNSLRCAWVDKHVRVRLAICIFRAIGSIPVDGG